MADRSRWDPEMVAAQARADAAAAALPPIRLELPLEPHRAANDALALPLAEGGPEMQRVEERWIAARGRRVLCRVNRPHVPGGGALLPAVVQFHGGGWVWSSVETHDRLCREWADRAGAVVVAVDYALSPEARFPQALEEGVAVLAWLAANGASWGIDGSRLALAGDSAGGNLALATALLARERRLPTPRGLLALYPVCDADFTTASYREFATGHVLTTEKMRFYWQCYAPEAAERLHPLAAPLRADLSGLPPVMVQLAELDVLRSEGEALAAKLSAAGVATTLDLVPGVLHGFARLFALAAARAAADRAGAWLAEVLRAG